MRPQNSFLENFDGNEWRDTRPKNESQVAVESEDQLLFFAKTKATRPYNLWSEQVHLEYMYIYVHLYNNALIVSLLVYTPCIGPKGS